MSAGEENHESGGYGIVNVQERIRLTFGNTCGLQIDSEEGKGTTVTIVHPFLENDMNSAKSRRGGDSE